MKYPLCESQPRDEREKRESRRLGESSIASSSENSQCIGKQNSGELESHNTSNREESQNSEKGKENFTIEHVSIFSKEEPTYKTISGE